MAVPWLFMRASAANSRLVSQVSNAAVGSSRIEDVAAAAQRFGDGDKLALGETQTGNAKIGIGSEFEFSGPASLVSRRIAAVDYRNAKDAPQRRVAKGEVLGTESVATRRSSCGMVMMPAAMASRGPPNVRP